MTEVAQGKFRLSDRGRSKVEQFMHAARQAMAEADPLPEEKSQRLASLLRAPGRKLSAATFPSE